MRRTLMLILTLALGLALTAGAHAGKPKPKPGPKAFIGLWEAIDSSDGSTQRLSITCSGRQSCDVRLNDTLFSL